MLESVPASIRRTLTSKCSPAFRTVPCTRHATTRIRAIQRLRVSQRPVTRNGAAQEIGRLPRAHLDGAANEVTLDIVRETFNGNVAPPWIFLQGAKDDRVQVASKTPLARWILDYGTGPVRLLF